MLRSGLHVALLRRTGFLASTGGARVAGSVRLAQSVLPFRIVVSATNAVHEHVWPDRSSRYGGLSPRHSVSSAVGNVEASHCATFLAVSLCRFALAAKNLIDLTNRLDGSIVASLADTRPRWVARPMSSYVSGCSSGMLGRVRLGPFGHTAKTPACRVPTRRP